MKIFSNQKKLFENFSKKKIKNEIYVVEKSLPNKRCVGIVFVVVNYISQVICGSLFIVFYFL